MIKSNINNPLLAFAVVLSVLLFINLNDVNGAHRFVLLASTGVIFHSSINIRFIVTVVIATTAIFTIIKYSGI
jgi:hypothetical protein